MIHLPRLFSLTLLLLILVPSVQAQPAADATTQPAPASLGRLFFTPADRSALDRQRATRQQSTQTLQNDNLTLNGTIVRSNGKRTYWINGHQQDGNAMPAGLVANTSRNTPGQTTFRVSGEPPATVRVGESANRVTHETESTFQQNVVVRKAR